MSKQLKFSYKGTDYTLEYTRRTVEQMEREGFVAEEIRTKPMTMLPTLFAGAFKAHHKFVKAEVIDEIIDVCRRIPHQLSQHIEVQRLCGVVVRHGIEVTADHTG